MTCSNRDFTLAEGEKLVKDFGPSLSREQTDYIYASIAERKRRKTGPRADSLRGNGGDQRSGNRRRLSMAPGRAPASERREERPGPSEEAAKQALESEAEVAAKLHEQLRQASWASFNQAERQFQLGEWREGIALLARAIKFDPENQVASERFFQELIVHREKALPPLIASFAHQDACLTTRRLVRTVLGS